MKTIARLAPYVAIVAGFILLLVAAAHAQGYPNGVTARESYPSNGNPYTAPGSYVNPYVLQNQRGQQVGTMTETYRSTNPYTQPGSAANPWVIHPSPYYSGQR